MFEAHEEAAARHLISDCSETASIKSSETLSPVDLFDPIRETELGWPLPALCLHFEVFNRNYDGHEESGCEGSTHEGAMVLVGERALQPWFHHLIG